MTAHAVASQHYLIAGDEFRVGTARWWGDGIIGVDAIYLLQLQPARGRKYFAFFEKLADRMLPWHTFPAGPYSDIPIEIRNDPRWPARRTSYCGALVIPKREVTFLYHERGKLETRMIFRGLEISIPHGRFGGKRVREFAEHSAWPMFWDGVPGNLAAGSKSQLKQEVGKMPFGRPYRSYTAITAGFLLGVLPIAFELTPRMNQDLVSTLWLSSWIGGGVLILFGWVALRRGL